MSNIIQQLNFNTLNQSRSKSNPQFNLQGRSLYSIESYAIGSFYCVNTFYTIDTRNNQFSFSEPDNLIRTFSIPTGNYTVTSFITTLQSLLNGAGTQTYTVTNNTLTNVLTITGATKAFIILAINFDCYYESGFTVSAVSSLSQVATNVFDFSGVKVVNIVSNSFGFGNNILVGKSLNVVFSIPITVPSLGVISFINPNPIFVSTSISEISTIEFLVYDELYRPLTMMNNWQLSAYVQI